VEPNADMDDSKRPEDADEDLVYVTVIVKPFRLENVLTALSAFPARSLIVNQVRGYGRQKGHLELYRGPEYAISFIPKVKIEVVIPRRDLEDLIQAVEPAARTGRIGDGKVFVLGIDSWDLGDGE
jgi:nitrogen regulatory protein P-II 2